jgi:SAM-dependent MidA family methyltransferase
MTSLGKSELRALLGERIRREGSLRFDEFMRECLYAPGLGYYERPGTLPGRDGDFMTSVSVGPVFGELLGDYACRTWTALGKPPLWYLCEQGAHHGHLAGDILARLQSRWPQAYKSVRLRLLEPSPVLRCAQAARLQGHAGKIEWLPGETALEASSWQGLFYSNELPDSFPVRRFVFKNSQWLEYRVGLEKEIPAWTTVEADEESTGELRRLGIPELDGYQVEWCPQAALWMKHLARSLVAGAILTIDYGWPASELYLPEKNQGSLTVFSRHHRSNDPLAFPGDQDLTAQVNFTELENAGLKEGLETILFTDQHRFLTRLATHALLAEMGAEKPEARKRLRQFQTLIRPELMGTSFKVLLQAKNPSGKLEDFGI